MARLISTYDAKARFSQVLRDVRAGERVVVTWHGKPVAEIRPYEQPPTTLAERIAELTDDGLVDPAAGGDLGVGVPVGGGLSRFLEERE